MNLSLAPNAERSFGLDDILAALLLLASGCLIAFKFFATTRININWDEFWFLSFVHALERNELTLLLQGAYTHLFTWLPAAASTEPGQIVAARAVMVVLLAVTAALTWDIARRNASGFAAAVAPLIYLGLIPVVVHGGSFRADSMLAPLLMGALALLVRSPGSWRHEAAAGALLGLAAAVTVKVLLFAPMLACFVAALATQREPGGLQRSGAFEALRSWIVVGGATLLVAIIALGLHALLIADAVSVAGAAAPTESIAQFASRTSATTLLHADWFPLGFLVRTYVQWQPLPWLLMGLGLIAALFHRRLDIAALSLALLPVAFYRNAFPYFYVVMMAPLAVLGAYAVATVSRYVTARAAKPIHALLLAVLTVGLIHQCFAYLGRYALDTQSVQRQIIAGIHEMFPQPVNYIDRCGMVSSFRKVGPFLSSWGIESYRALGEPVFTGIVSTAKPAFILMNTPALGTESSGGSALLEPDRRILREGYIWYWGPVRVAGGTARFDATQTVEIKVPFPALYRIEAEVPVMIDGVERNRDDIIRVDRAVTVRVVSPPKEPGHMISVSLFIAAAGPRPRTQPIPRAIFTGL